jgi:hypothetical protein
MLLQEMIMVVVVKICGSSLLRRPRRRAPFLFPKTKTEVRSNARQRHLLSRERIRRAKGLLPQHYSSQNITSSSF